MKNDTCPNCQHLITWRQHAKHSWWNPIICNGCSKKYNYDKAGFIRSALPIVLFSALIFIGKYLVGGSISSSILIAIYTTMSFAGLYSFYLYRRIKLVERI
jgi:CXXC-20-CXXC protein